MAIQGNYTLSGQVPLTNAYVKVLDVIGGKPGLNCRLGVFISKVAADGGQAPLAVLAGAQFAYVDGQDFIALAYDAVKKLPQWQGFTDC